MPSRRICLIDGVGLTTLRHLNLLAPQHELAGWVIEHECDDALAHGPYQHRRRSIEGVAREDLFSAGPEHVLDILGMAGLAPAHGEDRAERAIDVGIRGA